MAVSGTISLTKFNTLKVIEQAFRRCRLSAQQITAEMQDYAKDTLYLILSDIANGKCPSWCIEKQIYPFYQGQPIVTLDIGTVDVLNANYRVEQALEGAVTTTSTTYISYLGGTAQGGGTVNSVGVKWTGNSVPLTFYTSDNLIDWTEVGSQSTVASAGEITWTDIAIGLPSNYFKIQSVQPFVYENVYLGTLPQEIPMGQLNKDQYIAQSNKVFEGRPLTYWFKRDRENPKMLLWPAPNAAAEQCQLVVWRQRHIMDVGTLAQEIDVPQRWLEAIICTLASKLALETPAVDANMIGVLDQKAAQAMQVARDGDNDGSVIQIQPAIRYYTR